MPPRKSKIERLSYRLSEDRKAVEIGFPHSMEWTNYDVENQSTLKVYFQIDKAMGDPALPFILRPELQLRSVREDLLNEFANVQNPDLLIEYLNRRDIPDLRWLFKQGSDIIFSVERFLEAAASIYWLILMLDEIANNKLTQRLRNWHRFDKANGAYYRFRTDGS